ncbi:MAG: glycosyltransferase [Bacteroidetes bacterium]|nr:glycosyltransferase [Bacteroidota bacterium]
MNVVIAGPAYPLRGAMAQLNIILGWYLLKSHNVQIVSLTRQYPSLLFPGKTQIDPGKPLFDVPTVPLIDTINPVSWFRAARYIAEQKPDVVIFRYWMPFFAPCFGSIARLIKRKIKTQIIFICDNIIPHEKRPGDVSLTKYALRSADSFVVHSKTVEEDLLRFIPKARYVLSPLPLFDIFGDLQPKKESKMKLGISADHVMLFFGHIRTYKGLDILLDAMPLILKKISAILIIAGEFYENEPKYREKINRLGLEKHIRLFSDYIPNEEIPVYFSASDVVVLPYVTATQSAIVPVAYHFDKPAIVTDVGGLSEVVKDEHTGFVVPPQNPEALAEAVIKYYQDNRESEFITNIREEKKKYSWDTFIEQLEKLIKQNI